MKNRMSNMLICTGVISGIDLILCVFIIFFRCSYTHMSETQMKEFEFPETMIQYTNSIDPFSACEILQNGAKLDTSNVSAQTAILFRYLFVDSLIRNEKIDFSTNSSLSHEKIIFFARWDYRLGVPWGGSLSLKK